MVEDGRLSSGIRWALREPTLHFVLLAALLFAVHAIVGSRNRTLIEIDRAEVLVRVFEAEARRGAPLTDDERQQLEDSLVNERVLVREAMELGLDYDVRIHDILAQKMLHVLSADVIQPTQKELEDFYAASRGYYVRVPRVTVDEVVIGTSDSLPPPLQAQLERGAAPETLASDMIADHNVLARVSRNDLGLVLSEATAERVFAARPGEWVGPHHTTRGQHWLRVTERVPADTLPLEMVRDQVRLDWIAEHEAERLERRVSELRSRYRIVFSGEDRTP